MKIVYPYIAIDLDGTLLNSKKRISTVDYYAIKLYSSLGGKIILASGRSPLSTEWVAENLKVEKSIVAFNGAYIRSKHEKRFDMFKSVFKTEDLEFLIKTCDKFELEYIMYTSDSIIIKEVTPLNRRWLNDILDFSYLENKVDYNEYSSRFKVIRLNEVVDFMDGILKFVVLPNRLEAFENMFAVLQEHDFSLNKTPRYIEITNNYYDKGKALEKILAASGYSMKDIMAIGDNYNDLSMLRGAGLGVVVGNSPSIIQQQVDCVVSDNDNNGVAEAILQYAIGC